ncbi:DUF3597 domain-containing protein [Methylobacterium frigidaeris]|uniref:DUF3597 domain-containing protein n=1 Tax=Methylobacterium frigidaeris TaxID=2038277 RepID=A0AA37M355_9HYPH|nr:DUF3597 domain-containing protein [Methylobacterium frigidaeris]PIK70504.1 hypothetical protein CS379_24305 [Methylobacterium frigidaeris]GJD61042.1 hypothetical protein MPEAHAMD_1182 [Methylobacterium frigidaeris]
MSIFGSIMTKIFGGPAAAQAAAPHATETPNVTAGGGTGLGGPSGGASSAAVPTMGGAPSPVANDPAAGSPEAVDVGAVLQDLAARSGQGLDYKRSIVDLLKLLGLDSSLSARQELARELHYTGDTNDSAAMNVWLHAQVMRKLAENGGRVPDDLRHA